MGQTLSFNTGRGYTAEGQQITCEVIGKTVCPILEDEMLEVRFNDTSRGIAGVVTVYSLTQAEIMAAYDSNNYI